MNSSTTIAALATAPAPAGIAVVRVSGPESRTVLRALFRVKSRAPVDHPRELIFGELIDHASSEVIDHALAVFMPGPHSFTGEDVAEFQFHGSPLLVQKVLRSLFAFGAVPAEPGEFTKRAFLNGKLDLVQAESIAELISATSERALRVAGEHLKGRFSKAIDQIGEPLRDLLAELEAGIDFPEEAIDPGELPELRAAFERAKSEIAKLLHTYSFGQVLRDGFRVLLCGRPNAGKSSLLNLMLGRPRAIVSEISGTTRDLIEESATIGGFRFVFCDSAGIRETSDAVEKIGVELALERVAWADLVICVVDATDTTHTWRELVDYLKSRARNIWMVTNKIDLNPTAMSTFFCDSTICSRNFYLSVKTLNGFRPLQDALVEEVSARIENSGEDNQIITNERQRSGLLRAEEALSNAILVIDQGLPLEIVSAELRSGLTALQEIIGRTYTEDVLGRIFSKFCIGK